MKALRVIISFTICLLASCIESDEEITIHADGSGAFSLRVSMPPTVFKQLGTVEQMRDEVAQTDNLFESLEITHFSVTDVASDKVIQVKAHIADLLALQREYKDLPTEQFDPNSQQAALGGQIVAKLEGLSVVMDREIDFAQAFVGTPVENNPSFLGDSTFRYTLNLPKAASSHNAHHISNDGRSLHWSYVVKDHMASPVTMQMVAPVPIPGWVIPLLVVVALVILVLAIFAFRKFKRARA